MFQACSIADNEIVHISLRVAAILALICSPEVQCLEIEWELLFRHSEQRMDHRVVQVLIVGMFGPQSSAIVFRLQRASQVKDSMSTRLPGPTREAEPPMRTNPHARWLMLQT